MTACLVQCCHTIPWIVTPLRQHVYSSLHSALWSISLSHQRYAGWSCLLNCLCYHPLPCFYAFCWSAIPTSCYIFNVFILVHVTFLAADACLSWSLPAITEKQVSPHRLPMQYWLKNHWPDQAFFKHSPHTNSISNSAILRNNYISLLSDLCACIHVKKNGIVKEAIVLQWAVRITSCDFKPGKKRWAGTLLSE